MHDMIYLMRLKPEYYVPFLILACILGVIVYQKWQKPQKLRQKIAWVSIRECCFAIESFKEKYDRLPKTLSDKDLRPLFGWEWISKSSEFSNPFQDGWDRPIKYEIHEVILDGVNIQQYFLGSAGCDGLWEHPSLKDYSGGRITEFERDIVYCDGHSIQWPEGYSKD